MSTRPAPAISAEKAFVHLVYEYRHFALAAYTWNTYGPEGTAQAQKDGNKLVPGISTIAQDSFLLHARTLADFYTKGDNDPTDILSVDFVCHPIAEWRRERMRRYKASIEQHVLHSTSSRDTKYRSANPINLRGKPTKRLNWNRYNAIIAKDFMEALRLIARQQSDWQKPLKELYDATHTFMIKPSYGWPSYLQPDRELRKHLRSSGFSV